MELSPEEEDVLIMDKLFGPTRSRIAPPPTIEHLPAADMRFAVFTDIHIGLPGDRNWRYSQMNDFCANAVMQQINDVAPDLALHAGDASWGKPQRSAYFLRLLALCHATGVRLFWWNGPHELAGLLDRFYDPTPMFFAAQAWLSVLNPPTQPVDVQFGEVIQSRWRDREGRQYLAWWRPSAVENAKYVPLCNWPLIARNTVVGR